MTRLTRLIYRIVPYVLLGFLVPAVSFAGTIWQACASGDRASVESALAAGIPPDAPDPDTGMRPLHFACGGGRFELALYLVASGADIDARNTQNGETPLLYCIRKRLPGAVDFLIGRGASLTKRDFVGHKALQVAVIAGDTNLVRTVLTAYAAATNDRQAFRIFVDDNSNWEGETAVHLAAERGDAGMLRFLLAYSPSLNHRDDSEGNTALHRAVAAHSLQCVKILVEAGAAKDVRNYRRQTPADLAEEMGYADIAEYLR